MEQEYPSREAYRKDYPAAPLKDVPVRNVFINEVVGAREVFDRHKYTISEPSTLTGGSLSTSRNEAILTQERGKSVLREYILKRELHSETEGCQQFEEVRYRLHGTFPRQDICEITTKTTKWETDRHIGKVVEGSTKNSTSSRDVDAPMKDGETVSIGYVHYKEEQPVLVTWSAKPETTPGK